MKLDPAIAILKEAAPKWFDDLAPSQSLAPTGHADDQTAFRASAPYRAPVAVVLGSGLGDLANSISVVARVGYQEIPGLAASTAAGHRGEFLLGYLGDTPIIAMAGRLHAYEGHSIEALTRPMALMAYLRPRAVIVSCAAGGLNPRYSAGDLVIIDEHMSCLHGKIGWGGTELTTSGALSTAGSSLETQCQGSRFSGRHFPGNRSGCSTCDENLAQFAAEESRKVGFRLHRGSYLAVTGPNYETRAECRMMRAWGFDLVGMSTVPEVVLASRSGLPTIAIGVVTNMAVPDVVQTANHADVLAVSSAASDHLRSIVLAIAQSKGTFDPVPASMT